MSDEEPTPSPADVDAAETKTCPDCAETVKAAANVCRFCGHRFATDGAIPADVPPKSAAGAAVLGLVIPGTGHFYVGETVRGAVFLGSWLAAALPSIFVASPVRAVAIAISIAAGIDAYRAARVASQGLPGRSANGPIWAMVPVAVVLTAAGLYYQSTRPEPMTTEEVSEQLGRFTECGLKHDKDLLDPNFTEADAAELCPELYP